MGKNSFKKEYNQGSLAQIYIKNSKTRVITQYDGDNWFRNRGKNQLNQKRPVIYQRCDFSTG